MSESGFSDKLGREFVVNVEIVPPAVAACDDLATRIAGSLADLPVDAINLADSPLACPRMSPVLFAGAVRQATAGSFEVIPHITVRDRNRVALQGLIWGAVAMGTRAVLVISGDPIRYSNQPGSRQVSDLTVPEMVGIARELDLLVGVVFDPRPRERHYELRKLEQKLGAGAGYVITQPLFDPDALPELERELAAFGVPVLLGVLPLVSRRHAHFLHDHVPGISVPAGLLRDIDAAEDVAAVGLQNARAMLAGARSALAGACIMPPFYRFQLVQQLLSDPEPGNVSA